MQLMLPEPKATKLGRVKSKKMQEKPMHEHKPKTERNTTHAC